ncbi:hypothetical protein TNIN_62871 [Trichonephila inaurata madagascariensis]|uniref:Uncharacterized protein n=1 Tax=Trichonephila inaurata madagascariensis TaxID=2747483 RepID=A0A8X6XBK1_9ARAC|nr:hypothetical protein TNIN_62871 [Trichonephila inaurata madagascariensis]
MKPNYRFHKCFIIAGSKPSEEKRGLNRVFLVAPLAPQAPQHKTRMQWCLKTAHLSSTPSAGRETAILE